jgi:two-component system, cell cycle response regulator
MAAASVCLLGFSRFERATFESFFRLSAKRSPAYGHVEDPHAADFLIVDSDDKDAVERATRQKLLSRSLMLGSQPHVPVGAHLPRPINLMLIMRALDAMPRPGESAVAPAPAVTQAPVPVPAAVPVPPQPAAVQPNLVAERFIAEAPLQIRSAPAPFLKAVVAPPPSAARVSSPAIVPNSRPSAPHASDGPRLDHILVVDDSDIALRFMALHLQRFGYQIHLVRSGQEALERVSERHFEFVFLDVMMEGMDGYQTCKAIKRRPPAEGKKTPTVVMVTSRGTSLDKLRGTMAGCDAYLTKPLEENALLKIIGDREIQNVGYTDTAIASTLF